MIRFTKKNRIREIMLAVLPGLIVGGLLFAANMYYDIDTETIMMEQAATINTPSGKAISFNSSDDSNLTVTGSAKSLTLAAAGGGAQQLIAQSAGTGADAIYLNASDTAGGIDIDAGTGGITVDTTGPLSLDSTGTAANLTLTTNDAGNATLVITAINAGTGEAYIDIDANEEITIDSSAGSISLDAVDSSNFTVTGSDKSLTLEAADGGTQQLIAQSAGTGVNAIYLNASAGGLDIDTLTQFTINASAATGGSTISVAADADAEDLTISTTGSAGDVIISSVDVLDVDAVTVNLDGSTAINIGTTSDLPIDIDSSTLDIDSSGAITIDTSSGNAITINAVGAQLQLVTTTTGEIDLTSAELIDINAGANLDIDVTGTIDLLASTTFSVDGTGASNVSATSGDLTLSTITTGNLILTSAADIDLTATVLDIDSGTIDLVTQATDIDLIDNDASALSFDATDKAGILEIVTTNTLEQVKMSGDLAVNGGDITTTQTTFNLINATATTVNFAGAGTVIEIGAATGTTSINNALTVDGNTTLGDANTDTIVLNAYINDDVYIGANSAALSNAGFVLGGNDLFVAGMAGIEGNIYTDGAFIAGATTTYGSNSIESSATLNINTTGNQAVTFGIGLTTLGGNLTVSGLTTAGPVLTSAAGVISSEQYLAVSRGGTGVGTLNNLIALTTHTTGNYVANASTSALTGLTGGSAGSEGASLSIAFDYSATLAGNPALGANVCVFASTGLVCEGATADLLETLLTVTDPTVDRTITFRDASGTVILSGDTFTGDVTATLDTDGSTALTIAADSVALTTDTTGNYVLSIADAGSSTITVVNGVAEGGAVTLDAVDLNCTNCIGPTEITDLTLGTDTAGNYVASVGTGSGLSGGAAGSEGAALTLSLGDLTGDWTQSGAFDIILANTSSELKILESGATPTLYGIFDVADLATADKTYTFPDSTGTVALKEQFDTQAEFESFLFATYLDSGDNIATATALAANGANCSAGNAPLGVDTLGAVENCFDVWTEAENTAAGYISSAITSLGGLTGATQTFVNDTNVTMTSTGTTHTLGWTGTLADGRIASATTWNAKAASGANADLTSLTVVTGISRGTQSIVAGSADGVIYDTGDLTITGASTSFFQQKFTKADVTAATALTIDNAATVYIDGAPTGIGVGPATITNAYALWVDAGTARFDGAVSASSLTLTTDLAVADGGTGKSSWTQYLIPYADTTTSFSQIAIGTNGQILTSGGAGVAPAFQDAAAGGASTALDNLASVAINLSLVSDTAATDDLGTEALYWNKLYLGSQISFEGATDNDYQTTFSVTDTTTIDKTITFADAAGTVALGTGTANYAAYWSATNTLAAEQYLSVSRGGTGASTLNDLITLATHTTGNYVATITAGSGISGASSTEGGTPTIALSSITGDWDAGGFEIRAKTFESDVSAPTAPLVIASNTKVANLNADLLDGNDSSAFGDATAANQTTILSRIGTNSDGASMSSTLFAGQEYIGEAIDGIVTAQTFTSDEPEWGDGYCDFDNLKDTDTALYYYEVWGHVYDYNANYRIVNIHGHVLAGPVNVTSTTRILIFSGVIPSKGFRVQTDYKGSNYFAYLDFEGSILLKVK